LASKIGRRTTLAIARRRPWVPIIVTARARSISPSSSPRWNALVALRTTSAVSTGSFEIRLATSTDE
jgi:hypothetical protein